MFKSQSPDITFKNSSKANKLVKEFLSGSVATFSHEDCAQAIKLANSILEDLERASKECDAMLKQIP